LALPVLLGRQGECPPSVCSFGGSLFFAFLVGLCFLPFWWVFVFCPFGFWRVFVFCLFGGLISSGVTEEETK
jgi:hypothetical protein